MDDCQLMDVSTMTIFPCEGNISRSSGNSCGVAESSLHDVKKNPTGNVRCWASYNNPTDEIYRVANAIFEADVILFFVSTRWGQTNSIYQKLIERLSWIENRKSSLEGKNLVEGKLAGIILLGHNWRGEEILRCQREVLSFFGFDTPSSLSMNWQWTIDPYEESLEGYAEDDKEFRAEFLRPKFLHESYEKWFKGL